jgi:hypothetical protein
MYCNCIVIIIMFSSTRPRVIVISSYSRVHASELHELGVRNMQLFCVTLTRCVHHLVHPDTWTCLLILRTTAHRPITNQITSPPTNHKSDHQPTDQSQIRSPAHRPITNQITSPPTNHKSDHQPTDQSQIRSPAYRPITNQITSLSTNHKPDHQPTD